MKKLRKLIASLVLSSLFLGGVFSSTASANHLPDLIVENVTFSKTNPAVNEEITISATIKNIGDAASGGFLVIVASDGGDLAGGSIGALAAGSSAVLNMKAKWTTAGTRDVTTIADSDGMGGGYITEESESNNTLLKQITVIGQSPAPTQPSILSTALTLKASPKSLKAGKSANISGKLKDGNGKPVAGKKVQIKANGKVVKTVTTNSGGQFKFKHKPKKTTKYSASFAGDSSYSASSSKVVKVTVKQAKKKKKK